MGWTNATQDRNKWQTLRNVITYRYVEGGISSPSEELLAMQNGLLPRM